MILNTYAVLALLVTAARLLLGVTVVVVGLVGWWRFRAPIPASEQALQGGHVFLFQLAVILPGLNVASWFLLYLLLQSYVPEWPGVMCIYGVTRIGQGSVGPARFLPMLLTALQILEPVVVFLSGAWLVLHLLNRSTRTAPLTGRVLLLLAALGLAATMSAALNGAYLFIPKKEEALSTGCCTVAFAEAAMPSRFTPAMLLGEQHRPLLSAACYVANGVLALGLLDFLLRPRLPAARRRLFALLLGALLALPLSTVFLVEVAAPTLLGLPYHHCPYDLVSEVPEAIVGVVLYLFGGFFVGWAFVALLAGNCAETRPALLDVVCRLLGLGLFSYLGALVVLSVGLALA